MCEGMYVCLCVYVSRLPVIAYDSINVGYQPWSWRTYPKILQMNHQYISPPMMANVLAWPMTSHTTGIVLEYL